MATRERRLASCGARAVGWQGAAGGERQAAAAAAVSGGGKRRAFQAAWLAPATTPQQRAGRGAAEGSGWAEL